MKTSAVLTKARAKIEKLSNWTKRAYWRDGKNMSCKKEEAVRFCARGAVFAVNDDFLPEMYLNQAATILSNSQFLGIVGFNDQKGDRKTIHKLVLKAFDMAIELAKKDESEHGKGVTSKHA